MTKVNLQTGREAGWYVGRQADGKANSIVEEAGIEKSGWTWKGAKEGEEQPLGGELGADRTTRTAHLCPYPCPSIERTPRLLPSFLLLSD